ncbi:LRR receptor-like kinase resistance protein [Trifolium pratense]|uniref:LRR receptor-like kinase resistance protein n=1 Tax=Trifolium pratense TaxID=57577 RepID=A0A2K3LBQ7_TRIPR|nr:LRR receptor-like kinase resistance protein [Trifolium pratense]PNX75968.1 putative LRR receptor-like protein kinase [Trifolium pratense]PNX90842.1 LRR receptor-like kinase resistance protein [Trifolium pratense]
MIHMEYWPLGIVQFTTVTETELLVVPSIKELQSCIDSISPHVGNLSFLRNLNLANNSFFGKMPQELGRLSRFCRYSFSLTSCSNLKALFLTGNHLIGKITNWNELDVSENHLSGDIPGNHLDGGDS